MWRCRKPLKWQRNFQMKAAPPLAHQVVTGSDRSSHKYRALGCVSKVTRKDVEKSTCTTLLRHHNGHSSVSNHQPHDCLHNRLFRRRSQKTSKLRATGLCVGNSPGPVNSPHKGPVTRKMFPFDDVIMKSAAQHSKSAQSTDPLGMNCNSLCNLIREYYILVTISSFSSSILTRIFVFYSNGSGSRFENAYVLLNLSRIFFNVWAIDIMWTFKW